jgi:DNA primase
MHHLTSNGFSDEHLVDAGLVVVREDGRMYDRFRGRAMFAIRDDVGRVVGFSARILGDDPNQPKYINSPQSIVFEKSRVLYGLDLAKRKITAQRRAILVEGQADVVSLHQAGFDTTVASSGTALTREHLSLLKKYADTVVIVFDADNAGQTATTKGIELALQAGLDPRIVQLPAGTDPDAFVREQGAEAFAARLEQHISFIEFQAERFRALGQLDDAVAQARAVRVMLTWIAGVPDTIRHPFLVRELAERFRLDEHVLLRELDRVRSAPQRQELPGTGNRQTVPAAQPVSVATTPTSPPIELLAPERVIVRIALAIEDGLALLENKFLVSEQTFVTEVGRRLFQRIVISHEEHPDVLQYVVNDTALSPTEQRILADIAFGIERPSERWLAFDVELPQLDHEAAIRDALLDLRLMKINQQIVDLQRSQTDVSDVDERERIAYHINELIKRRQDILRVKGDKSEDLSWLHDDTPSASSSTA